MPTVRPRFQVTETPDLARALDLAARRWPNEPRSKLIIRLIQAGSTDLEEGRTEQAHQRLAAIDATSGKYVDVFTDGYLGELRQDWPARSRWTRVW